MADIILNYDAGPVFKAGGVCYVYDARTDEPVTPAVIDSFFSTCEECGSSSSSSSSSSSASSSSCSIDILSRLKP